MIKMWNDVCKGKQCYKLYYKNDNVVVIQQILNIFEILAWL